jgi:hypothetical protein
MWTWERVSFYFLEDNLASKTNEGEKGFLGAVNELEIDTYQLSTMAYIILFLFSNSKNKIK